MNDYTSKLLDKAVDTIEGAELLLDHGKEFSKTKLLDQKFHRWLRTGFDTRLIGDYHVDTKIEVDAVADMINQAREFLEAAREYLENS